MTEIDLDGIHFRIDAPSWMKYRKGDGTFTIKAIRAIREHHPDAAATLKSAVDGNVDHDLDENAAGMKPDVRVHLPHWRLHVLPSMYACALKERCHAVINVPYGQALLTMLLTLNNPRSHNRYRLV